MDRSTLTVVERETLTRAADQHSDLLRASVYARRNGSRYLVFGLLSILVGYFGDPAGAALGVALALIGFGSRHFGAQLAAGNPSAPMRLALGELILLVAVVVYCAAKLTIMKTSSADIDAMLGPLGGQADVEGVMDMTNKIVYPVVVLVTFLYQGGLVLYYRARGSAARLYTDHTPDWAREIISIVSR